MLRAVSTSAEGDLAYHRVLYAVGNNHAGTLFPAVIDAIPSLAETAASDAHVEARRCALEILIDVALFTSDRDFGLIEVDGARADLETWVRRRCRAAAQRVRALLTDAALASSAKAFLEVVEGG